MKVITEYKEHLYDKWCWGCLDFDSDCFDMSIIQIKACQKYDEEEKKCPMLIKESNQ